MSFLLLAQKNNTRVNNNVINIRVVNFLDMIFFIFNLLPRDALHARICVCARVCEMLSRNFVFRTFVHPDNTRVGGEYYAISPHEIQCATRESMRALMGLIYFVVN